MTDIIETTFSDSLLASAAWQSMADAMPKIATSIDGAERTITNKEYEISKLALGFVVEWHVQADGKAMYKLDRDTVRQWIYTACKRTGSKKEADNNAKLKLVSASLKNAVTRATRNAMLVQAGVMNCELDSTGMLVAPANKIRAKIDYKDKDGNWLKDQPNLNADLSKVENGYADKWARASGIIEPSNRGTGGSTGDGDAQTMQQTRDNVRLICNGNPLDYNLKERKLIREMYADLQGAVDQLDCENEDGEVNQDLLAEIVELRENAAPAS